ncbi:hypothetical protein ACIGT4_33435 [Streptomyces sioyaensis]
MPFSYLSSALFDVHSGQGLRQFAELAIALLLSSLIGLERETSSSAASRR